MKLFKALLIFWLSATAAAASAQRAEDSLAITDGPWKVLIDEEGVLCKKLQTRVSTRCSGFPSWKSIRAFTIRFWYRTP